MIYAAIPYVTPTASIHGNLLSAVSKTTKTISQTARMPNPKIKNRCNRRLSILILSGRPSAVPHPEQSVLMPHRIRQLLVRQRTMLCNAIRGANWPNSISCREGGHGTTSTVGPSRRSLRRTPMTAIEGEADVSWMSRNRRE